MTSSGGTEDIVAAVSVAQSPSAAVVPSCHSSVFSSPVSDLAFNLEVLSTDGFSSQASLSSDG